jgi:hypothetical protein
MKIGNPKEVPDYWDEGQHGPNYCHWYKKGKCKRLNRKRWLKNRLKELSND